MRAPHSSDAVVVEVLAISLAGALAWLCFCVADLASRVLR